jgi:hypothetical protein
MLNKIVYSSVPDPAVSGYFCSDSNPEVGDKKCVRVHTYMIWAKTLSLESLNKIFIPDLYDLQKVRS